MSAPPAIRLARGNEARAAAAVLADAFADEAGLNYWLRQGDAKDRARRLFFDMAVRDAVHPARALWIAEGGAGAAIWLSPGQKAFEASPLQEILALPKLLRMAGIAGMSRGFDLGKRLAGLHPKAPHAHLVFLGVAPAAQGRGVGSAILKATLAPLDAQGVTAYLEASTQRNVALYQRHGFEVSGELDLPNLHFWTMTRAPRT